MIGQTLGHYRIIEKIGSGGMGEVYRAHDEHLERDVAVKVLPTGTLGDESARKQFRKEALALSKLNHPNIAIVFDFDTQEGVDFLAMELVPGEALNQRLKAGALKEKEVVSLGTQLSEGLATAHAQGIVHRDLKPGNVLITPEGRLKILDFGLAKLLGPSVDPEVTRSLNETRAVAGTLPYMSPEQLRGEPADGRTDIYAAGVVLYEMATGRWPFEETLSTALVNDIIHKPPQPPGRLNPKLSPKLQEIILKCLEKEPENRYQSAKELTVDLRRLAMPSLVTATAAPSSPAWRRAARPAVYTAAGLVLVAALLVGLNVGGRREWLLHGSRPGRIESLAVLPLENLSGDPSQSYFADGITDELITDLGQISALRVISRTSVMHYKGTPKTIPEIARELHVDAVVEGSVERAGDQVRITAQLIEAPTDRHLWAKRYERELRNALQLQDEVAQAIAREIQVKLTPQEQTRLASSRPVNPDAYNDYLKGRYFYYQWTAEADRKAHEYFQQAIKEDPGYAPAWALWADTLSAEQLPPQETARRTQEGLQKALQLDDSLAEVHTAIAVAKLDYEWDWAGGERELQRAIELNPNYAEAHHTYSHYLMAQGRVEDSLRESQRALDCDPLNLAMVAHLAWHYLFARQYDQAIAQARRTLDLDPNYPTARGFLAEAEEQKGEYAAALVEFQKLPTLPGGKGSDLFALGRVGRAYALAGNKVEALRIVNQLRGKGALGLHGLAIVYSGLGDKENSLASLQKAADEHAIWAFSPINKDLVFDSLHSDPRFQSLLRRVGLPP